MNAPSVKITTARRALINLGRNMHTWMSAKFVRMTTSCLRECALRNARYIVTARLSQSRYTGRPFAIAMLEHARIVRMISNARSTILGKAMCVEVKTQQPSTIRYVDNAEGGVNNAQLSTISA